MPGGAPSVHSDLPASAWVRRWSHLLAPAARVLDVACGSGRHVLWFAQLGCKVTGVDRDAAATQALRGCAEVIVADLEGQVWPLAGREFDAVVATNYLWRDLLPTLVNSLARNGVLIYETFALGQESVGRPSNPAFLLRPGELLAATTGLRLIAFEDGFVTDPDRFVQRIVSVREGPGPPSTRRYGLEAAPNAAAPLKSADWKESP